MLKINDLTVSVNDKNILKDFSLEVKPGEIHVLMGQNGTGKSTLCRVLLKHEDYKITKGKILINDKDISKLNTTDIAREKVFLLNQIPIAIEGITNAEMLRMALSEIKDEHINIFEFNQKMELICQKLELPISFIHRDINVGMSGGERKKNELLHLWMLEPKLILLDEIDSGLDVDALKIVLKSLNEYYEKYQPAIIMITHNTNIIKSLKPEFVHIMKNGSIIKTGDESLANFIETEGFKAFNMIGNKENE